MPEPTGFSGEVLSRLARYGRVAVLDSVASTNDFALALASRREPAIVLARRQTKGRGRFHRHWFSDDSSLSFTLLVMRDAPDFPGALVTHLAGLSLCRAVENATGTKPLIRWPNDLMLGEKKLAGILCEARGPGLAIGVGLNVNQAAFPDDLPEATSLFIATGRTWDKLDLLEAFVKEVFAGIERASRGETDKLLAEVRERSLILLRRIEVKTLLRTHVGTCVDIDSEGRIVLRTDSGRLVVLNAGQVRRLR